MHGSGGSKGDGSWDNDGEEGGGCYEQDTAKDCTSKGCKWETDYCDENGDVDNDEPAGQGGNGGFTPRPSGGNKPPATRPVPHTINHDDLCKGKCGSSCSRGEACTYFDKGFKCLRNPGSCCDCYAA